LVRSPEILRAYYVSIYNQYIQTKNLKPLTWPVLCIDWTFEVEFSLLDSLLSLPKDNLILQGTPSVVAFDSSSTFYLRPILDVSRPLFHNCSPILEIDKEKEKLGKMKSSAHHSLCKISIPFLLEQIFSLLANLYK